MRHDFRTDGPVGAEKEAILQAAEAAWSAASFDLPEDFMQRSHFERAVRTLDWTSSPGYPWMTRASNNGQLFRAVDGQPSEERLEEFWQIIQDRIADKTCDPIRLFVKAEPHKLKKLEAGKYRLISSVSVVDQIIDHMLFDSMNDLLKENWMEVPSKIGWAAVWGGWRAMPQGETWMALDKSGWDWTVNTWLVELVMQLRQRLCKDGPHYSRWCELMEWRYEKLFLSPEFITSGGYLLRQKRPGVMKSGCVNTIADNSMMQHLLHLRVCFALGETPDSIICMGDDTLQKPLRRVDEYLELMGTFCKVKQVIMANEFAGFRFLGKRVEPLYKGKHAFILLHLDDEVKQQVADSYLLNYHRSAYRNIMEDLFCKMGANVVSRAKRDLIYDGF